MTGRPSARRRRVSNWNAGREARADRERERPARVLVVDEVEDRVLEQLGLRAAEHVGERRVDPAQRAARRHDRHADRRVVEQRREPLELDVLAARDVAHDREDAGPRRCRASSRTRPSASCRRGAGSGSGTGSRSAVAAQVLVLGGDRAVVGGMDEVPVRARQQLVLRKSHQHTRRAVDAQDAALDRRHDHRVGRDVEQALLQRAIAHVGIEPHGICDHHESTPLRRAARCDRRAATGPIRADPEGTVAPADARSRARQPEHADRRGAGVRALREQRARRRRQLHRGRARHRARRARRASGRSCPIACARPRAVPLQPGARPRGRLRAPRAGPLPRPARGRAARERPSAARSSASPARSRRRSATRSGAGSASAAGRVRLALRARLDGTTLEAAARRARRPGGDAERVRIPLGPRAGSAA